MIICIRNNQGFSRYFIFYYKYLLLKLLLKKKEKEFHVSITI